MEGTLGIRAPVNVPKSFAFEISNIPKTIKRAPPKINGLLLPNFKVHLETTEKKKRSPTCHLKHLQLVEPITQKLVPLTKQMELQILAIQVPKRLDYCKQFEPPPFKR